MTTLFGRTAGRLPEGERPAERPLDAGTNGSARTAEPRRRWRHWPEAGVLLIGLLATAAAVLAAYATYSSNENRLLRLRTKEVSSVLMAILPSLQTPLASATAIADAANSPVQFKRFIAPYVGTGANHPFVSASLWKLHDPLHGPVATVGVPSLLASQLSRAPAFLAHAASVSTLSVIAYLTPPTLRLGYGFAGNVQGPYVTYAESAIPADRRSKLPPNSAFSDIDFAIYFGNSASQADLITASTAKVPLRGRTDRMTVAFGDRNLTLVVRAHGPLGGTLPQRLPPIIAIVGLLLTLSATALTASLSARRRHAESLAERLELAAAENRRLYDEQRTVAQTLQHALLPHSLPSLRGFETSVRYEAGATGVEIGGDWYDLIKLDEDRLLLVVGDVSGRGLRAAATMAALRFAIHAYVAQGDPPPVFLAKLSKLVNIASGGEIATILCAEVDVRTRDLSVTSAGHLPPLLISSHGSEYVHGEAGPPVGVEHEPHYATTSILVPARATLVAFTDGLVERRGEAIDDGLERLRRDALTDDGVSLDGLVQRLLDSAKDAATSDDIAVAGIRWTG